jgi:hypothetical protein
MTIRLTLGNLRDFKEKSQADVKKGSEKEEL